MIDKAMQWLRKHWWGLIVAYAIALVTTYSVIWALIEPLGIPDTFESVTPLLHKRSTYHVLAALLLAPYLVLALELLVRKAHWKHVGSSTRPPPYDKGYDVQDAKTFYNAIASQYDQRNSPALLRTHEQVIGAIKNAIQGRSNVKVLDLGGGTGKLIAHHFFDSVDIHWVYVDESAMMAEQFNRNLERTKLKKTVQVEEITQYLAHTPDHEYEVIIVSLVLTSMKASPDWGKIAARLSKSGRLIVAEIDAAYTAINPYYIVKSNNLLHALRPRAVPLTVLLHETKAAGLTLTHSHPISEGNVHYAFVAEFVRS